jgi:competence protein ComEC
MDVSCCGLARLRSTIATGVDSVPASDFARGVVRAITVGDHSGLSAEAKALFRATGTSHLMAISGLHIGLLAGLGIFLSAAIWRRIPLLCVRVPARFAGIVAGLLVATLYAFMAGMGLPTQRALIMLTVFAVALLLRRESSTLHALAMAAVCVLLWHPPAVVTAGFWLSFVAVLAILAALRWGEGQNAWVQAVRVQVAISLALWPILMAFGMPASGVAPLVNLILVPLFGLLVVPMSLLGVILLAPVPTAGTWLLQLVGRLLDWIGQGLAAISEPLPHQGLPITGTGELIVLLIAIGLLLAPPGTPLRHLALPLFAIIWFPRAPHLAAGDFEIHLLDVGQGLSTVVETRHKTLVFDTGPEFQSGFSTAAAVVVPFLADRGRQRLDRLILSHGDKDHAGGVGGLLNSLDVRSLQSGEPQRLGFGARGCVAGEHWQWDGVNFEFLHPPGVSTLAGNNASCVLRITNAAGTVLLTGDIEEKVEKRLSRAQANKLRSRVVVAPHHGSRSSSSEEFIAVTDPAYVLYAAGWANRYGFPAAVVSERWQNAGAVGLNTAILGTISFRFLADGTLSGPVSHRLAGKRFWWHDSGLAEPAHAVSSTD